jgi:very-short-patch-repair endonuclease
LQQNTEPTLAKGAVNEVSGGFVMQPYNKNLKPFARSLRSNMTDAEQCLWQRIRNRQINGVQFYRQKTLLSFIVDFYSPKTKLVIELDGSQHFEADHMTRDQQRDLQLVKAGIKVLRFNDRQVLTETEAVLSVIYYEVIKKMLSPVSARKQSFK